MANLLRGCYLTGVFAILTLASTGCGTSLLEKPAEWQDHPVAPLPEDREAVESPVEQKASEELRLETAMDVLRSRKVDELPQLPETAPIDQESVCVIIAGDSWSFFDVAFRATERLLHKVFNWCRVDYQWGTMETEDNTNIDYPLVLPGTRAEQWVQPSAAELIGKAIRQNPNAKVVVMYIGGNDLLRYFDGRESSPQHDELLDEVTENVFGIIDNVSLSIHPRRINYLLVGYSKLDLGGELAYEPARPDLDDLHTNQTQINQVLERMAKKISQKATDRCNVDYIDNIHLFEDDPDKGTPDSKMVNWYLNFGFFRYYLFVDAIHIGKPAKYEIAQRTVSKIFDNGWLTEGTVCGS